MGSTNDPDHNKKNIETDRLCGFTLPKKKKKGFTQTSWTCKVLSWNLGVLHPRCWPR